MFKEGDMAMIVRHCGCVEYNWALGKPFTIKKLESRLIFCKGPMCTNPHMAGQVRTMLIPEITEPGFLWVPASWCIRLDPLKEEAEVYDVQKKLVQTSMA